MSEQPLALAADAAFPSLASMRAAHTTLLDAHRNDHDAADFWARVETFLQRGKQSGALLDREDDRWAAQSLLDYWTATGYDTGRTMPDAALVDFDAALAPELPDDQCPYVGLSAFAEGQDSYFFGRERLVEQLIAKTTTERLIALVGPSGSGKSSILLAGLAPALKDGAVPATAAHGGSLGSEQWRYTPRLVPGSEPLASLARALQPLAPNGAAPLSAADFLHDNGFLLARCNEWSAAPVVLIIDQFEEIFTLCSDLRTRGAFIRNLHTLIQAPGLRHTVLLTMRTDFESFVARLPDFLPHFEAALVRVTPLDAAELRAVIEKPAAMVGLKFEEGVTDALIQDVLGEPAALPLLQFTLLKLWERRNRNRITWETYQRLGGGRRALAHSADEFYDNLIHEEQVTSRRILLRLVRPGEGLEVTSNRVRRGVLYQTGEAHDRVDRVLQKLIDADLLRLSPGDRPEDAQVEVAHEALVRNWPRLVGWLEDERSRLRERLRITEAAEQWLQVERDPGALLRGALLEEAERYNDLNALEQSFVAASHQALDEAKRQEEEGQRLELKRAQEEAKREREWAAYQEAIAGKERKSSRQFAVITVVAVLLAVAAIWLLFLTNQQAVRLERTSQEALTQAAKAAAEATAASIARAEAVTKANEAKTAEAKAEAEAAAARTAEAEVRQEQQRLSHLSAALNYTGQQLDDLAQMIATAQSVAAGTPVEAGGSEGAAPGEEAVAATPTPLPTESAPTPTPPQTAGSVAPGKATPVRAAAANLAVPPTPTLAPPVTSTLALAITTTTTVSDTEATPTAAMISSPPVTTTSVTTEALYAIIPAIELNLYAANREDSPVLATLRAPMRLPVLQADAYWVQVVGPDSQIGWVQAWMVTYTGNTAQLPRELRYLVVDDEKTETTVAGIDQLPFTYGRVISLDGATGYSLLDNQNNPQSELLWTPVDTPVTLLFVAKGPTVYGSDRWYFVTLVDPNGQNLIWRGFLPAATIAADIANNTE
ncbi:MAG: hypothetical protein R3C14_00655 [Caldilineaceae bacterium]